MKPTIPKQPRPHRRRKGYILAIAMVGLLLITLLATNILLILKVQTSHLTLEAELAEVDKRIDEIGEQFLMGNIRRNQVINGFTCRLSDDGMTMTVVSAGEGGADDRPVLIVQKDGNGRILRWNTVEVSEGG